MIWLLTKLFLLAMASLVPFPARLYSPPSMRDLVVSLQQRPSLRRDFWLKRFNWAVTAIIVLFGLSTVLVVIFSVVRVPVTPLAVWRWVDAHVEGRPARFEKQWVSLDRMSPLILRAAIAAEDFRFSEHSGFDFDAIRKAIVYNERAERLGRPKRRGASTISQQTAKNVFLWPSRSWIRKLTEAWFTVLIETFWSKHRILEVYLNVIEFGDGVYGVEAASRRYFKKSAKSLNASEAALLVAVLPNPRRLLVQKPSGYVRFRQTSIVRRLHKVDWPE